MDCNRLLAILSTKRIVFLDKSQIFLCLQIFFRCSLAAGDHLCRPAAGTIIGIITGLGTNYFLHTSSITVWRVPSTAQPAPACTAEEMCKFITAPAVELETMVIRRFVKISQSPWGQCPFRIVSQMY